MANQTYQRNSAHERWVYKKGLFASAYRLLKINLSKSQIEKLNIHRDNLTYTVEDQLLLRYIDNRYPIFSSQEEILKEILKCIETYRFLLDSDMDPSKIRYVFLKALMDVISTGSGVYFLWGDSYYDEWGFNRTENVKTSQLGLAAPKPTKFGKCFQVKFKWVFEEVGEKYTKLLRIVQFRRDGFSEKSKSAQIIRFPGEQLGISYSYPLFLLEKRGELDVSEFQIDFFKRHKWCLERLSRCNHIFINKYKEKICEDMSHYLGKDHDLSYFSWIFPLWKKFDIPTDTTFLFTIRNCILSCFSSEELALFLEKDEGGSAWTFGDQIYDRYYSMYPSFASVSEMEESIKEMIEEYRPLLNSETAETVREIIMDEVERIAFVSKPTHLWNLEMSKNLKDVKMKEINGDVVGAVDVLIALLPKDFVENLAIEIEDKRFTLREQLLAR